jgi:hypothetical protein
MTEHLSSSPPATSDSQSSRTLEWSSEGVIAGTIGAVTLAVWFLILDLIQGQPFFTPALLGTAFLKGIDKLPAVGELQVSFDIVMWFTFVHWLVFALVGCAAAWLLRLAERNPNLGFGILLLFVFFEGAFLAVTTIFARPVLQALSWPSVLIGNLLAALAMGVYFWRQHRHLTIYP